MAAKETKTTSKKPKGGDDLDPGTKTSLTGSVKQAWGFLRSEQGRKTFALLLILSSIFLFVAFVSHFFTGYRDQSMVGQGPFSVGSRDRSANWLGSMGAWFADVFVHRGFGAMALLIPIFSGLLGAALLENNYYRFLWKLFKYTVFLVVWGSCFLSFMGLLVTGHATETGGGFGFYVNDILFQLVGKTGVGLLILLSVGLYAVLNFNADFPLSRWFNKLLPPAWQSQPDPEFKGQETEVVTQPDTEVISTPEVADPGSEPQSEQEEETEEETNFIISVRKETPLVSPLENQEGKEEVFEGTFVFEGEPKLTIPNPEEDPLLATTKRPEQESFPNGKKGEPDFVIETPTEEARVDEGSTHELGQDGQDNIFKTEKDTYEKIIQEEDQETLDSEEIVADWDLFDPTLELSDYKYPPIDLLQNLAPSSREVNKGELEENKNKIVRTLKNYSIDIDSIKATIGPTVTLYEIVPAPGVRISKIRNLEDDIALSLSALGIRIIAPIPGKGTIGIEIPNSKPEIVSMRSVLATEKFRDTTAELPIAIGKTISNEVYIADLSKMPHMLIAGATGQGKSVGINGLISSLLYKKHPAHVKFVLIDPKKVELNLYAKLEKHFLAKMARMEDSIITDVRQVVHVLNSLCIEMDERYDLLKMAECRNLREYNEKFIQRRLNPRKGHRFLPYVVLIIDEFADLMMTAGKEIETPVARLAQLARAIGIHLVLATQRPSVNVITGIIKANFPARVSFRVTSKVDSRTILDTGGADQLIGRGDLLFSTGSDIIRLQNPFIDTPEVEKLVDFIANQRGYPDAYILPEVPDEGGEDEEGDEDLGELDSMFGEAARLVVRHQQGSTSLIQRKLKLGYNRSGRIMDQLERAGIVGAFSGSKAREVLISDDAHLEQILRDLSL